MSKLNDLIEALCPDGVEYVTIKEVAEVGTGSSNGNEAQENGQYPFFIRSQTVKNKEDWEYDEEAIIIPGEGGIGEIYHYVNGKYAIHQRVYRIHFTDNHVNVKFAFHYFRASFRLFITRKAVSATVKSIRKPMIEDFQIPLPPLPVQEEIVRILDTFTELTTEITTELTTELTARKKQYEYYRDSLLTFSDEVEWYTLGEICKLITKGTTPKSYEKIGVSFVKTDSFENGYINKKKLSYVSEEIHRGFLKRSILEENDILFTITGATIGKTAVINADILPANTNQNLAIIRLNNPNNLKYILFLLQSKLMNEYIEKSVKGSAQSSLNLQQINKFPLPLPPIAEQQRIVDILDRFDTLCNDISNGLPAEIKARQQQYEHYRDKLLTFKKLEAKK